jgi:hypothetical protein
VWTSKHKLWPSIPMLLPWMFTTWHYSKLTAAFVNPVYAKMLTLSPPHFDPMSSPANGFFTGPCLTQRYFNPPLTLNFHPSAVLKLIKVVLFHWTRTHVATMVPAFFILLSSVTFIPFQNLSGCWHLRFSCPPFSLLLLGPFLRAPSICCQWHNLAQL